jgi:hypothetical protein
VIWFGSSCPTLSRSTPSSAMDGRSSRGGSSSSLKGRSLAARSAGVATATMPSDSSRSCGAGHPSPCRIDRTASTCWVSSKPVNGG